MTVTPVVDYEPPTLSHMSAPPSAPLRRAPSSPRPHAVQQAPAAPPSDQLRGAAVFADGALRRVLEVIDKRRPLTQLRPLLAGGLFDALPAMTRLDTTQQTAAVLRRVRLQAADGDETAVEVSATYSRGRRVHALACRIERRVTLTGAQRWQIVALHIG